LDPAAQELKLRLRAWQVCEDDLTRRMSEVELVLGDRKLTNNALTLREAEIFQGEIVFFFFSEEKHGEI